MNNFHIPHPTILTGRVVQLLPLEERYFDDLYQVAGDPALWTYIMREYWGTNINFECKLLLMTYAFDNMQAIRVQLKTKDTNIRSRTAIEKIGGKFEGILRKDRMQDDGTSRNSAYFSILDEEWPEARAKILAQMAARSV